MGDWFPEEYWTLDAYVTRHVEAKLLQLIFQAFLGDAVQLVKGEVGVGAAEGDAMALRREDGVVEVLLSRCESARYGPCACDVCYVAAEFL